MKGFQVIQTTSLSVRATYLAMITLLFLILCGIVLMAWQFQLLSGKSQGLSKAESDNVTWGAAQLEVDFEKFRTSLYEASTVSYDAPAAAALDELKEKFDIFYSRVGVISMSFLSSNSNVGLQSGLDNLHSARERITAIVDALDQPVRDEILALLAAANEVQPEIRAFALSALQVQVENATAERADFQSVLQRAGMLSLVILVLLVAALFLSSRLPLVFSRKTASLERVASNLSKTIEASQDAVMIADQNGNLIHFNEVAQKMFGHSTTKLQQRNSLELIVPGRFQDAHRREIKAYIETGKSKVIGKGRKQIRAVHASGCEFPVEASVVMDRDIDDRIIFISFLRDISDRHSVKKKGREALKQARINTNAKSSFLALMSHEMRTPLHGVIASLTMIDAKAASDSDQVNLQLALASARTAVEQIDDVLELTRLGDRLEPFGPLDPIEISRAMTDQFRSLAHFRFNTLVLDIDNAIEVGVLWGACRSYKRVLSNLIGNAIKFTKHGSILVRITAIKRLDGQIDLSTEVHDTGVGIAPENRERIFNAFERGGMDAQSGPEGSGLGLSIVKRAVELMGGTIELDSVLGKGSAFRFILRLHPYEGLQDEDAHLIVETQPKISKALDVLVVDDNWINRVVMVQMLKHLGHNPDEVDSGEKAVNMAASRKYDLVLMDINMPGMNGVEALQHIRSNGYSMTSDIIAVTAMSMPEDKEMLAEAGFTDFLIKPIDLTKLDVFICSLAARRPVIDGSKGTNSPPDTLFDELCLLLGKSDAFELINGARSEAAATLGLWKTAIADSDPTILSGYLHRAAGSVGVIGAYQLADIFNQADHMLKDDNYNMLAELHHKACEVHSDTFKNFEARFAFKRPV